MRRKSWVHTFVIDGFHAVYQVLSHLSRQEVEHHDGEVRLQHVSEGTKGSRKVQKGRSLSHTFIHLSRRVCQVQHQASYPLFFKQKRQSVARVCLTWFHQR